MLGLVALLRFRPHVIERLVAFAARQAFLNGCSQGLESHALLLPMTEWTVDRLAVVIAITARWERSDPLFVVVGHGDGHLD
jgi:hypothetical protein